MDISDSHCHLFLDDFDPDRGDVLLRARQAGVNRIVNVGLDSLTNRLVLEAAGENSWLFPAVGWHPRSAPLITSDDLEDLERLARDPLVVGFGEIGLDFYYGRDQADRQREVFKRLLKIASQTSLPVIIHCREAWDSFFEIIEPIRDRLKDVLLHCFSGGPKELSRAIELDCYYSIPGVITYPKAAQTRETLKLIPSDRLLVETDAPYLAPAPRRGRRNEPALLIHHLEAMGRVLGLPPERVACLTTDNCRRLFNLPDA
jgi:TatD DNase family protein